MNDQSEASSEASSHRSECVVMKFGGTSVEDAAAIRRLCRLVARPSPQLPVVVVSALAKVTDQLLHAGWMAAGGHLESARTTLEVLRQRHEIVAGDLVEGPEAIRLLDEFANEFKALDKMLVAIASEKALSPPSQDSLRAPVNLFRRNWCALRCSSRELIRLWWMRENASSPTRAASPA